MFKETYRLLDDFFEYEARVIGYSFDAGHHGYISILDRMTGYGYRDIETGFRDSYAMNSRGKENYGKNFWLASGDHDLRDEIQFYFNGTMSWDESVTWIKSKANNCIGEEE